MDMVCSKCGQTKDSSLFLKSGRNVCLSCNNAYHREYEKLHPRERQDKSDPNDDSIKVCSCCGVGYPGNLPGWHATVCPKCKAAKAQKYRDENREYVRELGRIRYHSEGKEERDAKRRDVVKARYHANPEKYREQNRIRYWKNPDKHREEAKEYHKKHAAESYARARKYKEDHPDKMREWARNWARKQSENPYNRMVSALRTRLRDALYDQGVVKTRNTIDLIGCHPAWLAMHLEKQFKPGMNWGNYGKSGWVIDHIIPVSAFDLNDQDQVDRCFGWQNLQPLWFNENSSKGDKMPNGIRARDIEKGIYV